MTQENLLSSFRAILIIVGSYVVGHNVFGHAVDSSTWQIIAGSIVTVASTIWGIVAKTTSIEGVESAVRSIITSVGGLLVSAGTLSGDNLNAILGLITALAPAVQSALSKSKNQQISAGSVTTTTTGKAVTAPPKIGSSTLNSGKLPLIIFLLFIGGMCNAQSPFRPMPKLIQPNKFVHATTMAPDSIANAWRFIADIAAYAQPGNILMAGVGYGYQHLKYDFTAQKWNCVWSVSAVGFAGGSVAPSTPSSIASFGVMAGIYNNLFMAGPIYNPGTKQLGLAVSIGISFNN